MSTKKYLAKKIPWDWRKDPNGRVYYVTEDGAKIAYIQSENDIDIDTCEFVLIKMLNVHHSHEYRYEVYKIPRKEAFDPRFGKKYLRWFGKEKRLGYIIRGDLK